MRLRDALIYASFPAIGEANNITDAVRTAISGGADIIQLSSDPADIPDAGILRQIAEVCREEDALLFVYGEAGLAAHSGADGVCLADGGTVPMARAAIGDSGLVGALADSITDARLALEVGVDFLLYMGGRESPGAFAGFREDAVVPLYAGGLKDSEDVAAVVEQGTFRLGLDIGNWVPESIHEQVAEASRMLGRTL